jgi:2-(1,2-epoxy-1,2-dihydrophenyl)acetyl-CoA isomerase
MQFDTLLYAVHDGVARITLNRPDAANALDLQMSKDIMYAATAADEDERVRAVVLSSAGKAFCAGGDLGAFRDAGEGRPALIKEMTTYLHAGISRLARMRAPVVASVRGAAAGAGFSLMCAADLAICAESAKLALAYTAAGLTPDGSATYNLPRLIGTRRALELMLTNRRLDAATALEWGLVNQVVPDDELDAATDALAASLASGATHALAQAKRLVLGTFDHSLEAQMELESRSIADAARTADADEGIAAFLDKRSPKFQGR